MRCGYFNAHWLITYQRYLTFHFQRDHVGTPIGFKAEIKGTWKCRQRPRMKRGNLTSFHRCRLAYNLVNQCMTRHSNLIPNLNGRSVPTQASRRHRHWQGRNRRAKHHLRVRRVVNHEFFFNTLGRRSVKGPLLRKGMQHRVLIRSTKLEPKWPDL